MNGPDAQLSASELVALVARVFRPRASDRGLALLVDLPGERAHDSPAWAARRAMAREWWVALGSSRAALGLDRVTLALYRAVERNNAELPGEAWIHHRGELPETAGCAHGSRFPLDDIFGAHSIVIALTERSATAPLKLAARRHGLRAASMPGFSSAMLPALRLDFEEVHRRCQRLAALLDPAIAAHLALVAGGARHLLTLDLRHRRAIASSGLLHEPGTAGNLPSGETYIVPYEGERPDDPSRSAGWLPLALDGELLVLRVAANRVVEVRGEGPAAAAERRAFAEEPAYANVAELGLGVLGVYGIAPIGQLLLDEKLGLHIAFGRSDHFGGSVGPAQFRSPDRVVHIDRVYLPAVQPGVHVATVDLEPPGPAARAIPLMRDGAWVEGVLD